MAIVEVTIVPLGTGNPSLSKYVVECHKILKKEKNLNYMLTPMGTIIEGDLDEILSVIRKMHEVPFGEGATRVSTQIKIDDRRDKEITMDSKVKSVQNKL